MTKQNEDELKNYLKRQFKFHAKQAVEDAKERDKTSLSFDLGAMLENLNIMNALAEKESETISLERYFAFYDETFKMAMK